MISSIEEKKWIEGINKDKSNVKYLLEQRVQTLEPINNFNLSYFKYFCMIIAITTLQVKSLRKKNP